MPGPRQVEAVPSTEPPKSGEPWTNSLGMPFVPVLKLPVLVAIWETRSRDFEAFAKSISLRWKPLQDGPDHPATNVSFLDGMLFCEWLTTNEEIAGRLKPGQHYRLPTDAEWSAFTGLPPEHAEALRERDDASDKSFPWGNAWPPPPSAGNFRGLNPANASAAGGAKGDLFEQTSPVGSFPPNQQGLFDIAGNVAEIVSDFIAPELGIHATRGGSYLDGDRRVLRTRARGVGEDDRGHTPYIGFRVVLDPRTAE
jgi:formylglycine-generating enzyme required for sulfatase activity